MNYPIPETAAEALLMRLKFNEVDYLFGNSGTDFASIIEAYAGASNKDMSFPEPLVIPHETAAIAMAHGYYLTTGKPQAAMVHVNVGLANSLMGLINASSDNIPIFMMAGRTALTEYGRLGSRMTPVQYGQEMRDQSTIIRESTKWDYELRYPEQVGDLVDRGLTIAMTAPRGPVYLGLPREPLAEKWPQRRPIDTPLQSIPITPYPDVDACERVAKLISTADAPLIICQKSDPEGRLSSAVIKLAEDQAIPVVESFPIQNIMADDHPMHGGFDVGLWLERADVILAVDTQVPWVQRNHSPREEAKVIHIGIDPLFSRMPVRSFKNDLSISAEPAKALDLLFDKLSEKRGSQQQRYKAIKAENDERRESFWKNADSGGGSPMSPIFVGKCISDIMDHDAVLFSELGPPNISLGAKGPNRIFSSPFSGGLGWGVPAALGASLADRKRLSIACIGDGSYIFANPVACHQIAEALELPILIVIMNNGIWNAVRRAARNVYPEGSAIGMNTMPLTSLFPLPDFCQIANASRGWSERVELGDELPAALRRALKVINEEKRHALLEVRVSIPN